MNLEKIAINIREPEERFMLDNNSLDIKLLDFWQWNLFNLVVNNTRGVLAEFIVKTALGIKSISRIEWDAFDLVTESGIKIEVKSAAYIQSCKQKSYSQIKFGICPTKSWDETAGYSDNLARQSDLYIFCLLHHQDQATINPLDLDQWTFYILSTAELNRNCPTQKTISLSSLKRLNPVECGYSELTTYIFLKS